VMTAVNPPPLVSRSSMVPRIVIDLDDGLAAALDRLIADTDARCPREIAAVLVLQDWLIEAQYLTDGETTEGTLMDEA
ncbi:hypothetical protein AB4144_56250, partial [Rhizobiaceae sp. 2RAB30]